MTRGVGVLLWGGTRGWLRWRAVAAHRSRRKARRENNTENRTGRTIMKRTIPWALIVAALTMLLSGCSGDEKPAGGPVAGHE